MITETMFEVSADTTCDALCHFLRFKLISLLAKFSGTSFFSFSLFYPILLLLLCELRFIIFYTYRLFLLGLHTFKTESDDGVRLYLHNSLLIDDWMDQSAQNRTGISFFGSFLFGFRLIGLFLATATLVAGKSYPIKVHSYFSADSYSFYLVLIYFIHLFDRIYCILSYFIN